MRIRFNKLSSAVLAVFFTAALTAAAPAFAASTGVVATASQAFRQGRADDALRSLDSALSANNNDASAWNLQCRVYMAQARWNDAIQSCERAVTLAPSSSQYHLWLARAYGEKAQHAGMMSAYRTAKRAHEEFETAVSLDSHNAEALSDLGEYYVDAPRILGGGWNKAQNLLSRLSAVSQERAEELVARIDEARKDYTGAEQAWRARVALCKSSPEDEAQAWMDLGNFYRRRARWNNMVAALKNGAAADKNHGPALVDGASMLIETGRDPQLAAEWLREYLNGHALSAKAPAFDVHAELGTLLRKQGDEQDASREFAAAHALSANYATSPAMLVGD